MINLEQLNPIEVPVKEDQEEELSRGSERKENMWVTDYNSRVW
jgi:hypothetical protein